MAAATLLLFPVMAACGDDVRRPPPAGAIAGRVSIEGMGVDGASVSGPPSAPDSEPAIPTWDYHTSTATVGPADFVLLYLDGEVEGKVVDLSDQDAHLGSVVELHQCRMFTPFDDAGTPTDGTDDRAANCTEYTGVVEEAAVDSEGNWSKGDLREGVYEVVVDLPAGYEHVNKSGAAESDADLTAIPVVPESYFTHQFAELTGPRAFARTKTFYIKDRHAGDGAACVGLEIDGADATASGLHRVVEDAGADARLRDPRANGVVIRPH